MKTISISKSTPEEINAAVAEYVAGLKVSSYAPGYCQQHGKRGSFKYPAYSTDANAVLPLLEKCDYWAKTGYENMITIGYYDFDENSPAQAEATARTFPLAACFSLLRAHNVTVKE